MGKYMQSNRKLWDDLTRVHAASEFYGVKRFKQGECTLLDIEREEIGDVAGKSLLHLQCHFGMDTLSWARLGALVTGMDFSEKAITLANSLAVELDIPAKFICCNLYDLKKHLSDKFDIVFTSAGVLSWLPDLRGWAEMIAHFLKPGGIFYIREFHPTAGIFDDEHAEVPRIRYPYFHSDQPMCFDEVGSYADRNADIHGVSYEWIHSLGDIIDSLIAAGLQIEFLHEFPYCTYQSHPFLTRSEDNLWRFADAPDSLPLMFSIKAVNTGHAI